MKKSVLTAAFLGIAAVAWVASGQLGANGDQAARSNAVLEEDAAAERLVSVRIANLEASPRTRTIIVNGRTEAFRQVEIRAETYGRVEKIMTRRGDRVDIGAVLGQLALDDRQARRAEAKALLRQREIEFRAAEQLQTKGFRSETSLAQAQAQLDAARAVVEQRELDITRTTLRAPFAGVIDTGHVEVGDYVAVGDKTGTIIDLDPILIVGYATEREVGTLQPGMIGRAQLVDGTEIEGIVGFVAATADPDTRTYRFELEAPNPDFAIRAGITSRIVVETNAEEAHFLSASALTLTDDGNVGVKTVDENDEVVFYPVSILQDTPGGVWVGGLPNKISVIVVGHEFVIEGQHVQPVRIEPGLAGAAS